MAKCNLGKVSLGPMQSAVAPICVRDLRGDLLEFCSMPRGLLSLRVTFQLIVADHLRLTADRSGSISGCGHS